MFKTAQIHCTEMLSLSLSFYSSLKQEEDAGPPVRTLSHVTLPRCHGQPSQFLWLNLAHGRCISPPRYRGDERCLGLVSELKLRRLKDAVSTQGEAIDLEQVFLWRSVFEHSAVRSLAAVLLCFRRILWSRLAGFHGDGVRSWGEEVW